MTAKIFTLYKCEDFYRNVTVGVVEATVVEHVNHKVGKVSEISCH